MLTSVFIYICACVCARRLSTTNLTSAPSNQAPVPDSRNSSSALYSLTIDVCLGVPSP